MNARARRNTTCRCCACCRRRMSNAAQPVGRLDADTTGLLLLSDDGQFIHHFTSPRRHVPKTYAVSVRHPLTTPS